MKDRNREWIQLRHRANNSNTEPRLRWTSYEGTRIIDDNGTENPKLLELTRVSGVSVVNLSFASIRGFLLIRVNPRPSAVEMLLRGLGCSWGWAEQ
jgi:hypothetical protein